MTDARLIAAAFGAGLAAAMTGGCASMADTVGQPKLSPIGNPAAVVGSDRVTMPLPEPRPEAAAPNSLWRTGARPFFGDQRASRVGDILTVNIAISDSAQVANNTQRSRTGSEKAGVPALFGFETKLQKVLPGTPALDPAISVNSSSSANGSGTVKRSESVNLRVAAVITDILANGNLVIGGSQEVRINNEVRELLVSGVVRPQDIAANNTIEHTQIAEARISYGGRGDISSAQRERYGARVLDKVLPF